MDDLEMVKACALAIGIRLANDTIAGKLYYFRDGGSTAPFDPLHDDALAMALVKKLWLSLESALLADGNPAWTVGHSDGEVYTEATDESLNRAICECVSRLPPSPESESHD